MSSDRLPNWTVDRPSDGEDPDGGPSRDDVFHVLQCRRRRLVLRYLRERGTEPVPVNDLADWLAAVEAGEDTETHDRSAAGIALRHVHLPTMEEADAVAYDSDRGVIAPTAHIERFERYLEDELLPSPAAENDPV